MKRTASIPPRTRVLTRRQPEALGPPSLQKGRRKAYASSLQCEARKGGEGRSASGLSHATSGFNTILHTCSDARVSVYVYVSSVEGLMVLIANRSVRGPRACAYNQTGGKTSPCQTSLAAKGPHVSRVANQCTLLTSMDQTAGRTLAASYVSRLRALLGPLSSSTLASSPEN
jgi:hypothetical protein